MSHKAADGSLVAGWAFFGLSLAEIQALLQIVALVLGIVATTITIWAHITRWRRSYRLRQEAEGYQETRPAPGPATRPPGP